MEKILSIGIDIGTSTTQIIFSYLEVENTASVCMLPNLEITGKQIIYRSPVYFTPMKSKVLLDMKAIREIVRTEYQRAGLEKEKIETGAVIITGESANKENAQIAAEYLSEYAGEFVVAVAGTDLEAILAGAGSGAKELSEKEGLTVVNFDIGGGTVNAAVYEKGKLIDAYGMHIGGRLLKIKENGSIEYTSKKLKKLAEEKKLNIYEKTIAEEELYRLCYCFAEILVSIVKHREMTMGEKSLFIEHEAKQLEIDVCTFSGGVGEYVYFEEEMDWATGTQYGDIGPFLGKAIRNTFVKNNIAIHPIKERIRATVIGAGVHSMKLSGSTIMYDEDILPLKNIPIVEIECEERKFITEQMNKVSLRYEGPIAFKLKKLGSLKYKQIKEIAEAILQYYETKEWPILLIMEEDYAKILGQTLMIKRGTKKNMICIDGISGEEGDYVDFCKPLGDSILVIIKTLLFHN